MAHQDSSSPSGLDALERDVARSLRYLGDDPPNWIPPRRDIDFDVVVVGAGQSGLATAFALRRAGIANFLVIDAAPEGLAGTWAARARMRTLRTEKRTTGPELGVPALSFPAWYEAQHGEAAYHALGLIPLEDWAAYIQWFQRVTRIPVRYDTALRDVRVLPNRIEIAVAVGGAEVVLRTRKLVLATGAGGSGTPSVPTVVTQRLPGDVYAHTDSRIDFALQRGRRVGVVGAAASAFDAAGVALEAGAAEVHLLCRSPDLAATIPTRALGYAGAAEAYYDLPDADRWHIGRTLRRRSPAPPVETVKRATRYPNFAIHLGAHLDGLSYRAPGPIVVALEGRELPLDFLVLGTGYALDPDLRPELARLAGSIARWRDRLSEEVAAQDRVAARTPYLGPGFELQEVQPGALPNLSSVYLFNLGAVESFGRNIGDNGSLARGIPRMVASIARTLFVEDRLHHVMRCTAPPPLELFPEQYMHCVASATSNSLRESTQRLRSQGGSSCPVPLHAPAKS